MLAPDLLGFGGVPASTAGAGDGDADGLLAPRQAGHVLDVLDRAGLDRAGLDRVAVVGHDFGGPVAAHLLARAPERVAALALFATNAFPDTPIPCPLSALNVPLVGRVAERALFSRPSLAMTVRQGVGRPRLDLGIYLGGRAQSAAIATIFSASLRRLRELYTPVEEALQKVTVPALVGWGTRDPFFPVPVAERTAQLMAGSRLRLYAGAGHFLPEERPDELAADLLELLALVGAR